MMKYRDYSVEDFLTDEDFKNWVLFPTEASNSYWKSLLEFHPAIRESVQASREILLSTIPKTNRLTSTEIEKDQVFSKILEGTRSSRSVERSTTNQLSWFYRVAAVLAIVSGLSVYLFYHSEPDTTLSDECIQMLEKENPKGRSSTIKLPDGSMVKLAANSKLCYPSQFCGNKREVWLEGKAFLEVQEDPAKPFYVQTGTGIYTKVLGTSFNVESDEKDHLLNIVLVTGKVLVEDSSHTVSEILTPNQKLTVDQSNGIITKSPMDYDNDLAWKDGILVLNKESVHSLKTKLENWYGVEVSLSEIKAKHQFTGKFKHKSLEYVMDAIAYASGIEYTLDNKTLKLKSKDL